MKSSTKAIVAGIQAFTLGCHPQMHHSGALSLTAEQVRLSIESRALAGRRGIPYPIVQEASWHPRDRDAPPQVRLLRTSAQTAPAQAIKPRKHLTPEDVRANYVALLAEKPGAPPEEHTLGSLWGAQNSLVDLASDYRAMHLHDTLTIVASVQTTAAQSGTVNTSRAFNTTSAVTGIMGQTPSIANPLFNANSATTLKGSGQTASNTSFQTSLTGTVIAVLPSGNLVVEAQRRIFMNNQHEDVLIRGMIRPGDIGPQNTIPSSALSNLEIEMKGKGIIADGTRPLNRITRAILWLFGF